MSETNYITELWNEKRTNVTLRAKFHKRYLKKNYQNCHNPNKIFFVETEIN